MYAITILIAAIFYFLIFFMLKEESGLKGITTGWKVVGKAKFPIWFWLLCFVLLFVPFVNAIGLFALLVFFVSSTDDNGREATRYTLFGLHLAKEV